MSELELMEQEFQINGKMRNVHFAIKEDVWLNATEVAQLHGKDIKFYWKNRSTKEYIVSLEKYSNSVEKYLVKTTLEGRYGGTYIHPDLVLHFARWCSSDFAVQCDMYFKASIRRELNQLSLDLLDAIEMKTYSEGRISLRKYLKDSGLKKILDEDTAWAFLVDKDYIENQYPRTLKRILVDNRIGKQDIGKTPTFYPSALDEIFENFLTALF